MSPRARYREAALAWTDAGWPAVLPVPLGRKEPVPSGFTGAEGRSPTPADYRRWTMARAADNAVLVLPEGVVGLDVDAYGGKVGHRTWARHKQTYGDPGLTWMVTSRSGGVSGIRLYRVDQVGLPFRGSLDGGDVDLIHQGLRYVTLPPSLHPEGRTYRLYGPSGEVTDRPPTIAELPWLPASWLPAITSKPRTGGKPRTPRREPAARPALSQSDARLLAMAESVIASRQGKVLRDRAGVNIDSLAERLGMSRPRASHLELGRLSNVRPSVLIRYGQVIDEWLGGSCGE